jgi:CheY-like chemotaxis protein
VEKESTVHEDNFEQSGLRILVVDDNRDAATLLSLALELTGHRTGTAHNGRDAVDAATRHRYDAVLLDLHMPVMGGLEAASLLQQLRPAPKLIAYSAWDDAEARRHTSAAGFSAHLGKPCELRVVEATLERLCAPALVGTAAAQAH